MRIEGNFKAVNMLNLRLNSMDTRLQLCTESFDRADRHDLEEPNPATITFEDSREIDQLIDALQKFKVRNERYIGQWKWDKTK